MPKVTFNTNIFISRKYTQLPDNFYMSVVVLQELVAGAQDDAELKALTVARREYERSEKLLVPTSEKRQYQQFELLWSPDSADRSKIPRLEM